MVSLLIRGICGEIVLAEGSVKSVMREREKEREGGREREVLLWGFLSWRRDVCFVEKLFFFRGVSSPSSSGEFE